MRELTKKTEAKRLQLEATQLKEGEVFLGNSKVCDLPAKIKKLSRLKSLRIGTQSFDITGLPLNRAKYRPLIISEADLKAYDKIMTAY